MQMYKVFLLFILLCATSGAALAIQVQDEVRDQVAAEYGQEAVARVDSWRALYADAQGEGVEQQLMRINRFFNQVPFISDLDNWGVEDYWATPLELLARFAADCEDYSIAKYLTLRALGVDEDSLRVTYVKAKELNQAHMVLTYYPTPQSDPLILDNLTDDIKPASERSDLEPVYSFNAEGLWLTKLKRADERRIGEPSRLQNWVELNKRLIAIIQ